MVQVWYQVRRFIIHVTFSLPPPVQCSFVCHFNSTRAQGPVAISAHWSYRTHCHLCPTGTHFHLSQVKYLKVKCLAQGHNIGNNIPRLRGDKHNISLKSLHKPHDKNVVLWANNKPALGQRIVFAKECVTKHEIFYTEHCAACSNQTQTARVYQNADSSLRKHEDLTQCCFNVGPGGGPILKQHWVKSSRLLGSTQVSVYTHPSPTIIFSPADQGTFSKTASQSQAYYNTWNWKRGGDIWRHPSAHFNMRSSSVYGEQCRDLCFYRYTERWPNAVQPFKLSRCIKASFYIPENRLYFPTTKGSERKFPWNWFTNTWQFSLVSKPHQIIFSHYKSGIATAIRGL